LSARTSKKEFIFVNDYTLQSSGYSRDEMEGQKFSHFVSPAEHEDMINNITPPDEKTG